MNPEIKKVLFIRFSSIGDIVLISPLLEAMKIQYPEARISILVKSAFASIIKFNPAIDEIIIYENHQQAVELLKGRAWDWVVDLQKNARTKRLKWTLKWKHYSTFPKINIQKWLAVKLKWKGLRKNYSIVERYFKALKPLGIAWMPELGLSFYTDSRAKINTQDIPLGHSAGYVLAVIGGSKATKRYPIHHWQLVVQKLNLPVIIIGGAEDFEMAEAIRSAAEDKVYNAIGKFNLYESALLTEKAQVVIANDTGFMHIAAAYQRPIVSLWGNTIPEFGMYPYYGQSSPVKYIILEQNGLSCRPCSKIGYDQCPQKHFKCMEMIQPERVVKVTMKLWSKK